MSKSLESIGDISENKKFQASLSNLEFEIAVAEELLSAASSAGLPTIEIFRKPGQYWNWARKLFDLGDVPARRNEPGDLERAREIFQQSLDMFTEMGAPGYIKVLEERLVELQGS